MSDAQETARLARAQRVAAREAKRLARLEEQNKKIEARLAKRAAAQEAKWAPRTPQEEAAKSEERAAERAAAREAKRIAWAGMTKDERRNARAAASLARIRAVGEMAAERRRRAQAHPRAQEDRAIEHEKNRIARVIEDAKHGCTLFTVLPTRFEEYPRPPLWVYQYCVVVDGGTVEVWRRDIRHPVPRRSKIQAPADDMSWL